MHAAADGTKLTKANWIFIYVCFLFIDLLSLCFSLFFSSGHYIMWNSTRKSSTKVRDEYTQISARISRVQETFHHLHIWKKKNLAVKWKRILQLVSRSALTLLFLWGYAHKLVSNCDFTFPLLSFSSVDDLKVFTDRAEKFTTFHNWHFLDWTSNEAYFSSFMIPWCAF